MGDFDLLQAIDCSPENEPSLFDKEETFILEEGLELKVSRNQKTLKTIANLVVAIIKLNKNITYDLREDELCSTIMDCVVEETVVKMDRRGSNGEKKIIFTRSNSVREIKLRDILHKVFTLDSGEMKLQAITLRAGHQHHQVNFEMSRYCPAFDYDINGLTVLLTVDADLHISCSQSEDKPELNLEKCSMENLREICENDSTNRFLFTKRTQGVSLSTFESVKFPGWFISTSFDGSNQSVEMCQETDGRSKCFRVL